MMKYCVIVALCLLSLTSRAQTILIIGDSLTEGYGLDTAEAFPAQLEKLLQSQGRPSAKVINGGISGSTTASGVQRVKWFAKLKPQVLVLALGANDGLRGLATAESKKNLAATVKLARESGMKVLLSQMLMPKNYGEPYRREFEAMYRALSRELKVPLLPFLLEGVGGNPKLNLPDGMHPNAEGQKIIAANLARALGPHL